jgi:aconitate hydratase
MTGGTRFRAHPAREEGHVSAINSFGAKDSLRVGDTDYEIYRIDTVPGHERLPFSLKVLLENLLRTEDGKNVTGSQISALGDWVCPSPTRTPRSSSRPRAS